MRHRDFETLDSRGCAPIGHYEYESLEFQSLPILGAGRKRQFSPKVVGALTLIAGLALGAYFF